MAHSVTRIELFAHLGDQQGFLERSARAFDEGDESEAKRLATALRVLVHDTGTSHSLLGQLGMKDRLRWIDTGERINPRNLAPTNGLVTIRCTVSEDGSSVRYIAPLGDRPSGFGRRPISFNEWWQTDLIKDFHGNLFARRGLVLAVANTDGGVHVDPHLADDYASLSRGNSLGATAFANADGVGVSLGGPGQPALGNPALAAVRQVAFEVERTLGQIRWLVDDDERAMVGGQRQRIDRDGDCACGSLLPVGSCCLTDSQRAFDLGNHLGSRGEDDLAIDAWQESVALGGSLSPRNLGLALVDQGDFEAAEEAFAIGGDRGDGNAASNLGCLRDDRGERSGAVKAWERGAELGSGQALVNLARIRVGEGERSPALELLLRGAETGHAESAYFAGGLEREEGNYDAAIRLFGEARAAGHPGAALSHGLMLKEAGMLRSAEVAIREAMNSTDPNIADQANTVLQELTLSGSAP